MTTLKWRTEIDNVCAEQDGALCNRRITMLHYRLSESLADALGRDAGPNFHSWAVWGSRKAGATIRQEDLDSAIHDATVVASLVGGAVGAAAGTLSGRSIRWMPWGLTSALGAGVGSVIGSWVGKQLAIHSRQEAARLVLEGNRIVLEDIGTQSVRFLELLEGGATQADRKCFFNGLRQGRTEERGQDRLAAAFRSYLIAFDSNEPELKRMAMISGNCQIVHHEHIRLEPYIRRSMPLMVRRCATRRLMTYEIGEMTLAVGRNLPGMPTGTAASDWTRIEERMRYIYALFTKFHSEPQVFSPPWSELEMAGMRRSDETRPAVP